jgi:hypothetical protein
MKPTVASRPSTIGAASTFDDVRSPGPSSWARGLTHSRGGARTCSARSGCSRSITLPPRPGRSSGLATPRSGSSRGDRASSPTRCSPRCAASSVATPRRRPKDCHDCAGQHGRGCPDDLRHHGRPGEVVPRQPHRHIAKSPAVRGHHPQAAADLSAGAVAAGERTNEPSAACSMTMRVSSTRDAMLSLRKAWRR